MNPIDYINAHAQAIHGVLVGLALWAAKESHVIFTNWAAIQEYCESRDGGALPRIFRLFVGKPAPAKFSPAVTYAIEQFLIKTSWGPNATDTVRAGINANVKHLLDVGRTEAQVIEYLQNPLIPPNPQTISPAITPGVNQTTDTKP